MNNADYPGPVLPEYRRQESSFDLMGELFGGAAVLVTIGIIFVGLWRAVLWFVAYAAHPFPLNIIAAFYYYTTVFPLKVWWGHHLTPYPRLNVLLSIVAAIVTTIVTVSAVRRLKHVHQKRTAQIGAAFLIVYSVPIVLSIGGTCLQAVWFVCVHVWQWLTTAT